MKIIEILIVVLSLVVLSAIGFSEDSRERTVIQCSSYLKDTGTRVSLVQTQKKLGQRTQFLVHEEMGISGYQLISRAQVAVSEKDLSGKLLYFASYQNILTLEMDTGKIISDRWGHPGHPSQFQTAGGETLELKCSFN